MLLSLLSEYISTLCMCKATYLSSLSSENAWSTSSISCSENMSHWSPPVFFPVSPPISESLYWSLPSNSSLTPTLSHSHPSSCLPHPVSCRCGWWDLVSPSPRIAEATHSSSPSPCITNPGADSGSLSPDVLCLTANHLSAQNKSHICSCTFSSLLLLHCISLSRTCSARSATLTPHSSPSSVPIVSPHNLSPSSVDPSAEKCEISVFVSVRH